jgi:hypothetical protein
MRQRSVFKSVISSTAALVALALTGQANAQQFVTQLHAPEPANWRWVGTSLAIDANTFVTGAPESIRNDDDTDCPNARIGYGAVAVYKKNGNTWSYAQKLWHDPTTAFNEIKFGNSISLRGNVMVVSAERQDYGSQYQAGAFVVFTRPNSNANFTKLGTYYSPTPSLGARMGETSGVASNTQFIAVGDPSTSKAHVYRIQNNSVAYAYSVPLPVPARYNSMFITDSNVLVGTIENMPTLAAFQLGPTGYTTLSTTALTRPNTYVTGVMSGDGNTVVTIVRDASGEQNYLTQVANFANGGVSWVDTRPIAPGLASPALVTSPRHVSVKENQGFVVSFSGSPAQFVMSYKFTYNGGTGHDYNYEGAFRPGTYSELATLSSRATAVAFNGVDLLLGDPDLDVGSGGGAPCGADSYGGVDVFSVGPVAVAGPSGSTKLQPWITSSVQNNGEVIASYSGYALVGESTYASEQGLNGQATLYRQVGQTWEQLEKYVDGRASTSSTSLDSGFGSAAALNYHSLFIGAPYSGSVATGAVYVADAVSGAYEHGPLTRTLSPPASLHEGDSFGSALALDNDTLLVGAIQGGPEGSRNGAAYVYTYNNATHAWGFSQELQPPAADRQPWLAFGAQVGVSGDYAVVSAPLLDTNGLGEPGAVYVYHRANGAFTYVQRLMSPQVTEFDDFGQTLSIANGGNYIAASGYNSGVRLFRLSGTSFVSDGSVSVPSLQYASVALSNVGLIVGTPIDSRVRRFTRVGNNTWALGGTLTGPLNQSFGRSVSMYDGNVLIGAPQSAIGSVATGAGYATTFTNVH